MDIFDQSYLLVSFFPGTRGFLLAKWLHSENVAQGLNTLKASRASLRFNDTNHDLVPAYADIVLRYTSDKEKITYTEFNRLLCLPNLDTDVLKELLLTSKYVPRHTLDTPYIIMTHIGSTISLYNWKKVFPNIKTMKIICKDRVQFEDAYFRKYGDLVYIENDWTKHGADFVNSTDADIVVPLDDIMSLNLEYLKGIKI